MFRFIKIAIISTLFISSTAFADADDWGYRHHRHEHYRYGYDQNYGGGYAPQMRYYPAQQPYYAQPPAQYYGYAQQMPRYERRDRDDRW